MLWLILADFTQLVGPSANGRGDWIRLQMSIKARRGRPILPLLLSHYPPAGCRGERGRCLKWISVSFVWYGGLYHDMWCIMEVSGIRWSCDCRCLHLFSQLFSLSLYNYKNTVELPSTFQNKVGIPEPPCCTISIIKCLKLRYSYLSFFVLPLHYILEANSPLYFFLPH